MQPAWALSSENETNDEEMSSPFQDLIDDLERKDCLEAAAMQQSERAGAAEAERKSASREEQDARTPRDEVDRSSSGGNDASAHARPQCSSEDSQQDSNTPTITIDKMSGSRVGMPSLSKKRSYIEMSDGIGQEPLTPLEQLRQAVIKGAKTRLKDGDIAVILDTNDLSKTCFLDSLTLYSTSKPFRALSSDGYAYQKNRNSGNISSVLVLEPSTTATGVPKLIRRDFDCVVAESLDISESTLEGSPLTGQAEKKVKVEPTDSNETQPQAISQPQTVSQPQSAAEPTKQTNWAQAYETLFCLIASYKYKLPLVDPVEFLPQLEGLVRIAKEYDCLQRVESALSGLFMKWVGSRKLWHAIAINPARWLLIGLTLEERTVFDEAFVHLVGSFPGRSWAEAVKLLPEAVTANIERKARDLRYHHYEIDQKLLCFTVKVQAPVTSPIKEVVADYHGSPSAYATVNLWRDWVAEHLAYLRDQETASDAVTANPTRLCKHSLGDCLTVAGFYRTIHRAGDALLSVEDVIAAQNSNCKTEKVRSTLAELKAKAAKTVAPFANSSLQFADRDKLAYLTCVEVEDGDVPWLQKREANDEDQDDLIMYD